MSASSHPNLALPKPRPKALDKADQRREREATDRRENAKVRRRSYGCCERREAVTIRGAGEFDVRCYQPARDIHHLISGSGRRNRGRSILAEHKLHVCRRCHDEITRHVLEPRSEDAATVTFMRRR